MELIDFLEDIDSAYGHAYFPDFEGEDIRLCAQLWRQECYPESEKLIAEYYPDGKPVGKHNWIVDFQDYIEEWIDAEYDKWKEYN